MNPGALGGTAKRHAGKGIAIVAAGVAAAVVFTASASATSSGGTTTLRLTGKAAATVFIKPCRTCVTSVPAGLQLGQVADVSGALVNGRGARVGRFASVKTAATPRDLVINLTLVLGQGQITAQGIEPMSANGSTIAITGGTGRYQSAGGEIRFRDTSPTVTQVLVIIDQ